MDSNYIPFPNIRRCPNPETCDQEHNLCGEEDHHYGCECQVCQAYYYRVMK
jgi:hypothetical protein